MTGRGGLPEVDGPEVDGPEVDEPVTNAFKALGYGDFVTDDSITRDGFDAIWAETQSREEKDRMRPREVWSSEAERKDPERGEEWEVQKPKTA